MAENVIDRIFDLFEQFGSLSYGEDATQVQHALQTAQLARRDRCSDALIAAALLHDIGQFIDDAGNAAESHGIDARHEHAGSAYLGGFFPRAVTEPVRLHVAAKRYLCAFDPDYLAGLSRASALSLALQGGAMSADEIRAFEAEPFFDDAVRLRRFDDMGKQPDWHVPDLASYRPLLQSQLRPVD